MSDLFNHLLGGFGGIYGYAQPDISIDESRRMVQRNESIANQIAQQQAGLQNIYGLGSWRCSKCDQYISTFVQPLPLSDPNGLDLCTRCAHVDDMESKLRSLSKAFSIPQLTDHFTVAGQPIGTPPNFAAKWESIRAAPCTGSFLVPMRRWYSCRAWIVNALFLSIGLHIPKVIEWIQSP